MKISNIVICMMLLFSINNSYANKLFDLEYDELYKDLLYWNVYGYKAKSFFNYKHYNIQGSLKQTGKNNTFFSFSIVGDGFFKVYDEKNGKYYYTRNGEFDFDGNGWIVNLDGYKLYPFEKIENYYFNNVSLDANILKIKDPTINKEENHKIVLFKFQNLESVYNGKYFIATGEKELADYRVIIHALEMSTTDVLKTINKMMFILEKEKRNKKSSIKSPEIKFELLRNTYIKYNLENTDEAERQNKYLIDSVIPFLMADYNGE